MNNNSVVLDISEKSTATPICNKSLPIPGAIAADFGQAAAMLGVCRRTIERLVDRNDLRDFKVGRLRRIRIAEINDYVRKQESRRCLPNREKVR